MDNVLKIDTPDKYIVPGLDRGLRILCEFSRHERVLSAPELARRLADTDAAIIMKLGQTFPGVVEAVRQAGLLERAVRRGKGPGLERALDADPDRATIENFLELPVRRLRWTGS